jgi:hypothetical protein
VVIWAHPGCASSRAVSNKPENWARLFIIRMLLS